MKIEKIANFCEKINYLAVIMLPFGVFIGLGLANALMITMAVSFFIARLFKKEKLWIRTPVNLFYGILLAAVVLSFKNTLYLNNSIRGLERWLVEYPLLFLVVSASVKDVKHIKLIILSTAISVSVVGADAIWQFFSGKDFIWGEPLHVSSIGIARATGTFNDPNLLGIYLGMLMPLLAAVSLFYQKEKYRIFMLVAFLLGAAGFYLTFSRGAGLALWAALLFLAIMKKNKIVTAILVALLVIYPFIMPKNIKDWAKEMKYNPAVFLLNHERLVMFKNTTNMIRQHPFVGVGINTFSKNYAKYKLPEPEYAPTPDTTYTHNMYLQAAGEMGLIGLGALLLFLFALFRQGFAIYAKFKDEYLKTVSIALLACFVAFLINGISEATLQYPGQVIIFWYLAGVSLSLKRFT